MPGHPGAGRGRNQIELKEDENALDTFNLSRMDADDDRRSRYANEEELADAGFDYVPEEEVEAPTTRGRRILRNRRSIEHELSHF